MAKQNPPEHPGKKRRSMRWRSGGPLKCRSGTAAKSRVRGWNIRMLALGLSLLSLISITISLSAAEPRIFNVKDFGARADGTTIDTAAIQKALDACGKAGGGTVRFAPGKYLTQPIFLHSKTRLELSEGAMLIATTNREDYLRPDHTEPVTTGSFLALVNGKGLMDISITGKGIIDGSGEPWWGPAREAKRTN